MTFHTSPPKESIDLARARLARQREIQAGSLPTVEELLSGLPPLGRDWARDASTWSRGLLAHDELDDAPVREALGLLASTFAIGPVRKAKLACKARAACYEDDGLLFDAEHRLAIYGAILGELDGAWAWSRLSLAVRTGSTSVATILGFASISGFRISRSTQPVELFDTGRDRLKDVLKCVDADEAAMRIALSEEVLRGLADLPNPDPDEMDEMDDRLSDVVEDRAEITRGPGLLGRAQSRLVNAVVVVAALEDDKKLSSHRRDVVRPFREIAGKTIPLTPADTSAAMVRLAPRFPHASEAIAAILRDMSTTSVARFRPVLLLGSPGCGKTALARALGDALGLGTTVYACAGQADASFMGTSSQWSTSRPSVPLELIRASGQANPLVILDEIEKAGTSTHNGSLVNALLTFLERAHASAIRDLALEVDVDLSWVNYVATANSLAGVPAPLLDRFRVIEIPDPDWSHVGDLARSILDDIAAERGIDRRWIDDLAADELDVLHKAWPGGSIRKLRRALEVLVDGRDQLIGRA